MKDFLRPFYSKQKISKEDYKEIMRKIVPKVDICDLNFAIFLNKSGKLLEILLNNRIAFKMTISSATSFQFSKNRKEEVKKDKIERYAEKYVKALLHKKNKP